MELLTYRVNEDNYEDEKIKLSESFFILCTRAAQSDFVEQKDIYGKIYFAVNLDELVQLKWFEESDCNESFVFNTQTAGVCTSVNFAGGP